MDCVPYSYLIGWSHLNKWYYGCQFGKGCNPSNLWKTYFTSSRVVREFVSIHGNPDVIQIRKTFSTPSFCRRWEHKVLRRLNVVKNQNWLNKTDNQIMDRTGLVHSDETKIKMRGPRSKQVCSDAKRLACKRNALKAAQSNLGKQRNNLDKQAYSERLKQRWALDREMMIENLIGIPKKKRAA